jgi:oxalate decarboxylase/phosphoglucose isomerase-like protein (cupin superfamily)
MLQTVIIPPVPDHYVIITMAAPLCLILCVVQTFTENYGVSLNSAASHCLIVTEDKLEDELLIL